MDPINMNKACALVVAADIDYEKTRKYELQVAVREVERSGSVVKRQGNIY